MTDKKYVFANWKMYLNNDESVSLAAEFAEEFKSLPENIKMAVFPSALSFSSVIKPLQDAQIGVGAQNVHWVEKGGYTGEVSAPMYKSSGAEYALVGHSERRHLFHETNHEVRQKVEAILLAGLTPVICVGETQKEREENKTEEIIEVQMKSAYHNIVWPEDREMFVAYEPVWAVGTGTPCDPVEAERMHNLIKKQVVALTGITPIILYGGSVRPENAQKYLNNPDINGVLVGGASANFQHWKEIVESIE